MTGFCLGFACGAVLLACWFSVMAVFTHIALSVDDERFDY